MINPAKNSFHTSHQPWGRWLRNVSESYPYIIFKDRKDGSTRKLYRSVIQCQCCGRKYHGCSGWHLCSVCNQTFCMCCHKSRDEHERESAEVYVSHAVNDDGDEGYSVKDFVLIAAIVFVLISYFTRSSGSSESPSYTPSVSAADDEVVQVVSETDTPIMMRDVQSGSASNDEVLVRSKSADGERISSKESMTSKNPGVNSESIRRMLSYAELQYSNNNFEKALFSVNNVLLFDSENRMANELKEKIELAMKDEISQ